MPFNKNASHVKHHISIIYKGNSRRKLSPPLLWALYPSHVYITEDWAETFLSDGLNFM